MCVKIQIVATQIIFNLRLHLEFDSLTLCIQFQTFSPVQTEDLGVRRYRNSM